MSTDKFNWWPKCVPIELMPVIRSASRKIHPHGLGLSVAKDDLSVQEHGLLYSGINVGGKATVFDPVGCYMLGKSIDQGVKRFAIPEALASTLNEIEIPLKVKDFTPPFPACVVKSGDEWHIVVTNGSNLCLLVYLNNPSRPHGSQDVLGMCDGEKQIEEYLTDQLLNAHTDQGIIPISENFSETHRFRATLNFLLICTLEGVAEQPQKIAKHLKSNTVIRRIAGKAYKPQNIGLLKDRYGTPGNPTPHLQGIGKRPHWRRAHWRRVAVGAGRTDRKLMFFKAALIHRELVGSVETTEANYKV